MEEKRRFTRIKFVTDVRIKVKEHTFDGDLIDLSLNGALMHSNKQALLTLGEECELCFYLPSSDITLVFNVKLSHSENQNLGFEFVSEDLDTMTHLRRLLELNMGDDEKITEELSVLGSS